MDAADRVESFSQLIENADACEVCEKELSRLQLIGIEVADGDALDSQWVAVCGEDCLQQVIVAWKQICEIVRPGDYERSIL